MKIVIAGGTGFLGTHLVRFLCGEGHVVTVLTRNLSHRPAAFPSSVNLVKWDGRSGGEWESCIEGADAIVNLTGQSLASGRWTRKRKHVLLQSRIQPARAIVEAISRAQQKPRVFVSSSAVGYYPSSGDRPLIETDEPGEGFMGQLCKEWEQEAWQATSYDVRVVLLRMGVVLAREGGALPKMILPFRLFFGGPVGPGNQYFPWIHRDDVLRIVGYVLTTGSITGPVNVVALENVTMKTFSTQLGKALRRPSWLAVPAFMLTLILGEMAETLLSSQRVIPFKLKSAGFSYRFPELARALDNLSS